MESAEAIEITKIFEKEFIDLLRYLSEKNMPTLEIRIDDYGTVKVKHSNWAGIQFDRTNKRNIWIAAHRGGQIDWGQADPADSIHIMLNTVKQLPKILGQIWKIIEEEKESLKEITREKIKNLEEVQDGIKSKWGEIMIVESLKGQEA